MDRLFAVGAGMIASVLPQDMPVIHRPPVVLRAFRGEDVALVQSVFDDPLIPLITTVPATGNASDAEAYLQRQHDRLATGAGYSFAITDATAGQAVGQIGLWLTNPGEGRVSTGYWIAQRFRQRGYATAALLAISRWGLSLPGVHRVELHVEPWNTGSWRAAEHAGFMREGLLRSFQQVGTHRRDMYLYSLLPADVDAAGTAGATAVSP